MIGRLHFEEGYPLDLHRDLEEQVHEALRQYQDQVEILPARRDAYPLTPSWWTKNNLDYRVEVHPDGSGTFYATPREDGNMPETPAFAAGRTGAMPTRRGLIRELPEEGWIAPPIAGPLKDRQTMGIHEIVIFVPGPSPQIA